MFEVLVYLYENYFRPDACPDADTLARKLSAAGFEGEEINDALSWLSGLAQLAQANPPAPARARGAFRIFTDMEYERLGVQSIGFLCFLESADVITANCARSSSSVRWPLTRPRYRSPSSRSSC